MDWNLAWIAVLLLVYCAFLFLREYCRVRAERRTAIQQLHSADRF
jgi:hypothetical protein